MSDENDNDSKDVDDWKEQIKDYINKAGPADQETLEFDDISDLLDTLATLNQDGGAVHFVDQQSIGTLVEILEDDEMEYGIRQAAIAALALLGDPGCDALVECGPSREYITHYVDALAHLAQEGNERAIEALIDLMMDDDWQLSCNVIYALEECEPTMQIIEAICICCSSWNPQESLTARNALEKLIGHGIKEDMEDFLVKKLLDLQYEHGEYDAFGRVFDVLDPIYLKQEPETVKLPSGDEYVEGKDDPLGTIFDIIGRFEKLEETNVKGWESTVNQLLKVLTSNARPIPRVVAIVGLQRAEILLNEEGKFDIKPVVDALIMTLGVDRSESVRRAAARALGVYWHPDTDVYEPLSRALRDDDDDDVRRSVVTTLGRIGEKMLMNWQRGNAAIEYEQVAGTKVALLLHLLENDPNDWICNEAATMVTKFYMQWGNTSPPDEFFEYRPVFDDLIRDPKGIRIQSGCIDVLTMEYKEEYEVLRLPPVPDDVIDALSRALDGEDSGWWVKSATAEALGELQEERAMDALIASLRKNRELAKRDALAYDNSSYRYLRMWYEPHNQRAKDAIAEHEKE